MYERIRMPKILVMYSNEPPSTTHVCHLRELREDIEVIVVDSEAVAIDQAADADIILGHRYLRQTLPHTRCLRWVQSTAAGVHHLISPDLIKIFPVLTRCPIFADAVAIHALSLALSILRRIPDAINAQNQGRWSRPLDILPLPRSAMILGMGYVGRAIASILRRQKIIVLGVNRSRSPEIEGACDELLDDCNWRQQLYRVDLLFVTLPLTTSTVNLVDEPALQALPSHAVLVDVSRGRVVNINALVKLLKEGHLGGAAVDVLDPIPESARDPIWKTPGLLITPKMAVFYRGCQRDLEEFIEGQVKRYLESNKLLHQVDIKRIAHEVATT